MGFFSPLKQAWQDAVAQYQHDEVKPIDKRSFARVFYSAYKNAVKLSTMVNVNAIRTSGIYLVNWQSINPKKLGPFMVHSLEPVSSSSNASCSIKPGLGASKLALQALEEELDEATNRQFNKRFEEGYDLTSDALYTTWAKLKRGTQQLADISNIQGVSTSSNPASASDSSTSKASPAISSYI